jgi:hemolysin-activating ACP:hemolysin acyltransferase
MSTPIHVYVETVIPAIGLQSRKFRTRAKNNKVHPRTFFCWACPSGKYNTYQPIP